MPRKERSASEMYWALYPAACRSLIVRLASISRLALMNIILEQYFASIARNCVITTWRQFVQLFAATYPLRDSAHVFGVCIESPTRKTKQVMIRQMNLVTMPVI
jgi:hypothetical protein